MSKYRCGGSYDCKALSMRGLSLAGKDLYIKFRVRTKEEGLSSWKSTIKELSGLTSYTSRQDSTNNFWLQFYAPVKKILDFKCGSKSILRNLFLTFDLLHFQFKCTDLPVGRRQSITSTLHSEGFDGQSCKAGCGFLMGRRGYS